jgi:hypothetical protein
MTYGAATLTASVKFEDWNNQTGNVSLNAADLTKLKAGLELLNAISNAKILEVKSTATEPVTAGANTPVFGAQREYLMNFECTLSDGTTGNLILPAPKETILQTADKRLVDLADTNVAAFVAWLLNSANGVTIRGLAISAVNQAWTYHNKSKTETKRRTIG